jgi:hypothetical protein
MSINNPVAEGNTPALGGELFTNHIFGRKCMTKNFHYLSNADFVRGGGRL